MVFVAALRIVGAMLTKVESTRRGAGDGQVIGGLLVVVGVGWLLHRAGVTEVGWRTVLSAMLVTLGVGLVFTARRSGAGLVVLGVVLTIVLAATSSAPTFDWNRDFRGFRGPNRFGDRMIPLAVLPEAGYTVDQRAGDIDLDLRNVTAYTGTRTVNVRLDVGDLVISLPSTMRVKVDAHVGVGDIQVLDQPSRDGIGLDESYTDPDFAEATQQLVIDARVNGGEITIIRAPAE